MDKLVAALMIKHGNSEIELTEEDFAKVDTFYINWFKGTSEARIMANRLPIIANKVSVPIVITDTGYSYNGTSKKYWSFLSDDQREGNMINMVIIPDKLDYEERIDYITMLLKKIMWNLSQVHQRLR